MDNNLEEEKKKLEKRLKEIEQEQKKKKLKKIKGRLIRAKNNIVEKVAPIQSEPNTTNHKMSNKTIKKTSTRNNNINLATLIILVVILSLISGFLGAMLVFKTQNNGSTKTISGVTTSTIELNETNSISTSVEKIYDAVVVVEGYTNNELTSTGTGFVYKKSNGTAYIMTNSHVVADSDSVKVLFTNGDELETKLVGRDTYSDIAVLSVKDSNKIVAATTGASKKSKVGDTVFTVGSPEGSDYAGTVTKGVISAKERLVAVALSNTQTSDYYMNVLQTDAAINPGNSGGPICNTNGEVIGITNMKLVDDSVEGMGFAIPIEDALSYAETLEKDGKITRPYIGISMLDLTDGYTLWRAGITLPENIESGVAVYSVESNSPADKAGLKKGDIITKLGDAKTENLAEFRYELYKLSPNEEIEVTYIRDGKETKTKIELGKSE